MRALDKTELEELKREQAKDRRHTGAFARRLGVATEGAVEPRMVYDCTSERSSEYGFDCFTYAGLLLHPTSFNPLAVKIGVTKGCPWSRIATIQQSVPGLVLPVFSLASCGPEESLLLAETAEWATRGEWRSAHALDALLLGPRGGPPGSFANRMLQSVRDLAMFGPCSPNNLTGVIDAARKRWSESPKGWL